METQIEEIQENSLTVNPIIEMIDSIVGGELTESNSLFYDLLSYKLNEKIELRKIEVAQRIFGESKDDDDDDDDNKSSEVGEKEENELPSIQLGKIASFTKNTPEENELVTKTGGIDKRKVNASTGPDKPETFKHKNGEESEVSPEHARMLMNIIQNGSLGKHQKGILNGLHDSKQSFIDTHKKIQQILNDKNSEKSIYGADARTA